MRIEIFVVKTEIDRLVCPKENITSLEAIKREIVHEFGGMTKIPDCEGYWEEPTKFYADNVEIWLIYTQDHEQEERIGVFHGKTKTYVIETNTYTKIEAFAKRIKNLTSQKAQAFTIDGKMYLV